MNSRWFEIWPAAPLTATLIVCFHVAVSRGSSCGSTRVRQQQ